MPSSSARPMKPCNIFQIQRLSVNDGEGIRTTVFFKGCNLRCRWCANPESWHFEPQLMFLPHKCVSCGACVSACPRQANWQDEAGTLHFNSSSCTLCGSCINICPAQARQQMGKSMSIDAVISELKKDYLFYAESGGGVTFSGGEPYLHPEYLAQLTNACHALGIDTCSESCGFFDFDTVSKLIADMDALFFDIKIMNTAKHKHYTGQSNDVILENIAKASAINKNITVRVPVIADVNDDYVNMHAMCKFLTQKTSIRRVELLSYHKLGLEKMTALGMPAIIFHPPTEQRLEELKEIIADYGIENVSYK